jgi:SNF2 family DNA or RNA helicase
VDVYIINRENVPWLVAYFKTAWPFDMVILDESSSFKDPSSKRFRALKMNLGKIKRLVLLTGTPAGNGLMDLWSQMYLLDRGERLYDTITQYRMRYFHNPEYKYVPVKGADAAIYETLKGIVISMKNEEYLHLPERLDVIVPVKFSPGMQKRYDDFERDCVMEMGDTDITAFNSGALSTKLLQFANGAIYDSDKNTHTIHDQKIEALEEVIESAGGKPVLIFYSFQSDLVRIQKRFGAKTFNSDKDIQSWNKGEIPIAVAHPASAGHGLNLQECANIIVWFGLTWSLELYMQANARLHRQGQKQKVYIYHIVSENTMDQDVMKAIEKKAKGQNALMEAVKARVEKYKILVSG